MFKHRHKFVLMSAIGAALSAGGAAVAHAVEKVEEVAVTGLLRATHAVTEQVCDFDTLEQLEHFLANVAENHQWIRHDKPAAAPEAIEETAPPASTDTSVTDAQQNDATNADVSTDVVQSPAPTETPPVPEAPAAA